MNVSFNNELISQYLEQLEFNKNNIQKYYHTRLTGLAIGTQINHLISINKLFQSNNQRSIENKLESNEIKLKHTDVSQLTENDIIDLLESEWYQSLKPQTRKLHVLRIKKYLKFSKRHDLVELLPKKFKIEAKELSKNDLISRENLDLILKFCNVKNRTLIMVMYEGALRRDELLNIKKKHIKFNGGYAILKLVVSKTKKRDIPLTESLPYLKEYINNNYFESDDLLFSYKKPEFLNLYLIGLKNRIAKKYPEWKSRKLYPHLFRHSRLTELVAGKLNHPQINKFAGWTADSNMAKIYFHLDDQDIINILTENETKKPELKKFKSKFCPVCNAENNSQNTLCWKCNNFLDETKRAETGLNLINLKENQEKIIKLLMNLYFKRITKEKYPDMELDNGAEFELINRIIHEYNDIIK